MFKIRGKHPGQPWEDIDVFDTREEALKMLREYRMAWPGVAAHHQKGGGLMMECEQLSMFTMNVDPVTATCCMDGCPARASPVEPWMAALITAGEYVVQVAGHPLVLRPMPGRQADIQRGHEYYHYMIGGRLYAGTFVGRDSG